MDKDFFKGFMQWLDTASHEELMEKKERLQQTLNQLDDTFVKRDVERLIKFIDEEIVCRLQVERASL